MYNTLLNLFNNNYILCFCSPLCTICGYAYNIRLFFKNRCMGDDTMASEYTDSEQQLAVSTSEYDQHEDSIENDEKHIMAVKETEDSFIVQYAKVHDEEQM